MKKLLFEQTKKSAQTRSLVSIMADPVHSYPIATSTHLFLDTELRFLIRYLAESKILRKGRINPPLGDKSSKSVMVISFLLVGDWFRGEPIT